jgi:NRPS condensation-like uncharacterized protein
LYIVVSSILTTPYFAVACCWIGQQHPLSTQLFIKEKNKLRKQKKKKINTHF